MTLYKSTRTRTLGCDQHSRCIWFCQTVWYSRHSVKSIAPERTVWGELLLEQPPPSPPSHFELVASADTYDTHNAARCRASLYYSTTTIWST